MNPIDVQNLVKIWYNKYKGNINKIEKEDVYFLFLCLWVCFNCWLAHESGKFFDWEMTEWLKKSNKDLKRAFNESLKGDPFLKDLKVLIGFCPIVDSRTGQNKKPDISIVDENDFENIVDAIYRLRCNLFHGGVSVSESKNQQIYIIVNKILNKWIGNLVNGWK